MEYNVIDKEFKGGYSITQRNNRFGLIDKEGNEILKCEYVVIRYHSLLVPINRILFCTSGMNFGFANYKGDIVCIFEKNISFDDYFNSRYCILPFIKYDLEVTSEVNYCIFKFLNTNNNGLTDRFGNFLLRNYYPCRIHSYDNFEYLIIESTANQNYRYFIVDPKTSETPTPLQSYSKRLKARTNRLLEEDIGKSMPAFDIESFYDNKSEKEVFKIQFEEEDIFVDYDLKLVNKIEFNKFQQIKRAIKFSAINKLNNI